MLSITISVEYRLVDGILFVVGRDTDASLAAHDQGQLPLVVDLQDGGFDQSLRAK